MPELDDFLTVEETADALCLNRFTIYGYLRLKAIKGARKFANRWMIPRDWVDDYLNGYIDTKGVWKDWRVKCQNLKKK